MVNVMAGVSWLEGRGDRRLRRTEDRKLFAVSYSISQTIAFPWSDIDGIVENLLNDAVDGDFKTGVHTV